MSDDYYKLLGVSRGASQDEIQKAYRNLARKYHPDLNPDDKAAQQKFKDIQHAYDVLGEPEKRQMYDQFGPDFERASAGSPFGGRGAQPGGNPFGGGGFQFDGDLGDLFKQFGGGGFPGGGYPGGGRRQESGSDLSAELTVPFSTSVLGGEASVSVRRHGKQESLTVKIPAGIESGKKIRLRGQGEAGPRGGKPGDLLITISVAPHPCYRRNGKNLELKLPVSITEAALGATVEVPTPGGTVALKIPPGSSGGRRLRIKGQGVRSTSGAAGDLLVELQLVLPPRFAAPEQLDDASRHAAELLGTLYDEPVREKVQW